MFSLIDMIIVRPITNILFLIYGLVGDFGVAIILFTLVVKICLWPVVKRQMHQTHLMRKIQPELAEIKKNCNGNRQLESIQMLDLYKRNNIKPFRSVLTLIIQLPIFIALYTAVKVMVLPTPSENLSIRAYEPVAQMERVDEVIHLQETYLEYMKQVEEIRTSGASDEEKESQLAEIKEVSYDFHPKLFNVIDLDVKAGFTSFSSFIIMLFALASALTQYWVSRQQLPTKKKGRKTFRQIMAEAADGKEPDQAELNQIVSGQMAYTMPVMMLILMINLPGALVFYYLVSNLMTGAQQKYLLGRKEEEMEISADKKIIRELKQIEEAEVVDNSSNDRWVKNRNSAKSESGKSGVKITRISAKSRKSFKRKRS